MGCVLKQRQQRSSDRGKGSWSPENSGAAVEGLEALRFQRRGKNAGRRRLLIKRDGIQQVCENENESILLTPQWCCCTW